MTLAELGSVGELVGAIAVVVTLIILIFQVRGARTELSRQMTRDIKRHNNEAFHQLTRNPELADLHVRGQRDFFTLTETERVTWMLWLFTWINQTEDGWIARKRGIPGMDWVDTYVLGVALVLRSAGGCEAWKAIRGFYETDFVRALEQVVEQDSLTWLETLPSPPTNGTAGETHGTE